MFSHSIFRDIGNFIFDTDQDHLRIRDGHRESITHFLEKPNFDTTLSLYRFIAEVHKKSYVFNLMDSLRVYEAGFTNILREHREHYLHSASVYVLGLAIFNRSQAIRNALRIERHEGWMDQEQKTSFLFRWSLAACLHDLAYPLELSLTSFNQYSAFLDRIEDPNYHSFITVNRDIYKRFNLLPILRRESIHTGLDRKGTAIGLIAHHLTRHRSGKAPISYEALLKILKKYLNDNLAIGRIDHGAFSSFIVLKRIYDLYNEHADWDIWDYYYEVVDAATAIFLHNSYRHSQLKDIYGNGKFMYDYPSALGYLLYLTDTLCEWLRGKRKNYKSYGVFIDNDIIRLRVPRSVKSRMRNETDLFDERVPVIITDHWTP